MQILLDYLPDLHTLGLLAYVVVFVLVFFESFILTGMFTPGAVITVLLGGFAAQGYYSFSLLVVIAAVASMIGDGVSFELGRSHRHLIERRPWLMQALPRVEKFFERFGSFGIIFGRFFGWTRPLVPFAVGMSHYSRNKFYPICIVSCSFWSVSYLSVGYLFGAAWQSAMKWSMWAVIGLVVLAAAAWGLFWLWKYILLLGRGRALELVRHQFNRATHLIISDHVGCDHALHHCRTPSSKMQWPRVSGSAHRVFEHRPASARVAPVLPRA